MLRAALIALSIVVAVVAAALLVRFEYAPMPDEADLLNPERRAIDIAFDVMGRRIGAAEAERLALTEEGRRLLSPESGAVAVDDGLVRDGRAAFWRETFGNEIFFSDVMGILDGALTPWSFARAILALGGGGTSDLRVRLARGVTIAGMTWREGETVSTGLDVPAGGLAPLGMKVVWDRGRIRVGMTCALCHAAVDPDTGKIVEGAPNADLRTGFLLALAANSAAYFVHTGVALIEEGPGYPARLVRTAAGRAEPLPDPTHLEAVVDEMLAAWPPGSFDSTVDLVNNPTSIPSAYTDGAHPYGWTGFAMVGPFRGLFALSNNVHASNSDATVQAAAAPWLLGIDPETYLGTLLQRAAHPRLRFDPASGERPSEVLRAADPHPDIPGLNHYARLPDYPRPNYVTSNSLISSRPGEPVGRALYALAAFQDRLAPPLAEIAPAVVAEGEEVFAAAGCAGCHAGPRGTDNRIVPADRIGSERTRARARASTRGLVAAPRIFAPDTPYPPPPDARLVPVPVPEDRIELAWAHDMVGGYKVAPLLGLRWSAPYLHDGGVAVGPDADRDLGARGTVAAGRLADPANSLRALLDRELRARVIAANHDWRPAQLAHVTGEGHAYWVDAEAGYTRRQQDSLVALLLAR